MRDDKSKFKKLKKFIKKALYVISAWELVTRFRLFRKCAKLSELNAKNMNKMANYSLLKLAIVWSIHALNLFHLRVVAERGFYMKLLLSLKVQLQKTVSLEVLLKRPEVILEGLLVAFRPYQTELINMGLISTSLLVAATVVGITLRRDEIGRRSRLLKSDLVEYGIQNEEKDDDSKKDEGAVITRKLYSLWTPDGVLIESRKNTEKNIREMETFWNSLNRTPGVGVQDGSNRHLYFFPFGFILKDEYLYDYGSHRKTLRKV